MLFFMILLTLTLQPGLSQPEKPKPTPKPTPKPPQRCENDKGKPDQYDTFLKHHLNNNVPKNLDKGEWQTFIKNIDTLHRPIQSFFPVSEQRNVLGVCSTAGKIYPNTVNLCISKKTIKFFNVYVDTQMNKVTEVKPMKQYVILGCEKIENKCRPIHFEGNDNDAKPENNATNCS